MTVPVLSGRSGSFTLFTLGGVRGLARTGACTVDPCVTRRSPVSRRRACRPRGGEADLARLRRERFDVLIVGGGVTGAGAALDAASRGLSVALVEARDLASGTSSRSSKLVHGGLRYLEQLEFGLVHEALQERGLLATRLAPHLVRPMPFLVPLPARRGLTGAGRLSGSGLLRRRRRPLRRVRRRCAGRRAAGMPLHRHLSRAERPADLPVAARRTRSAAPSGTSTARSTTPAWSPRWPAPRPASARPW